MKTSTKDSLVQKIKEKKELKGIASSLVRGALDDYLKKYKININLLNKKQIKIIIKEVRAGLRNLVGQYQKSLKNKSKLPIKDLLKTHSSTAERLDFYPKLKKIISQLKVKSILDLGCGLNPLALANKKVKYHASDIKEDELEIIEKYFKKHNIEGKTFVYDLRKPKKALPKVDLCLIFKVLDILANDKKSRAILTEKILKEVPCKKLFISFSTIKLSGRKMNFPKRYWFENMLERKNLKYKTFSSDNEVFYLVDKA